MVVVPENRLTSAKASGGYSIDDWLLSLGCSMAEEVRRKPSPHPTQYDHLLVVTQTTAGAAVTWFLHRIVRPGCVGLTLQLASGLQLFLAASAALQAYASPASRCESFRARQLHVAP